MNDENILTTNETSLIENIINKLQTYMIKSGQTLYSLANTMGFAYQPFHRLIKNRNLPTVSTLAAISEHLKCSIEELISNKIFLDVPVIDTFQKINSLASFPNARIYINYEDYYPYVTDTFFAIKLNKDTDYKIEYCKIYTISHKINTEGSYIVDYNQNTVTFNVISTSSTFIIIEENKKEQRIPQDQVKPIAKFFNNLMIFDRNSSSIYGVR